ncbi:MAG TPA: aldo/keto reductase [Candidatus Dormibacteraeota bacterium]
MADRHQGRGGHRKLGPEGAEGVALELPRVGLGTAPLGNLFSAVPESEARALVERAWTAGIRLFDTAPLYGYGLAERRLGALLSAQPRDSFLLSTKVGRLVRPRARPEPGDFVIADHVGPVWDFSYEGARRSLEESLDRLRLNRVDIALIHDPDDHHAEALGGAYRALHELREQGVVRAIGAGMNQAEALARFAREGDFDVFLVAGRHTLLEQPALPELLPLCVERGIQVMVGGVFNSGLLAGGATYNYRPAPARLLERAQALEATCARHGVPLKAAALQFPYGHPAVASVLLGCRSVAQLEENLALLAHPVPPGLWSELKAEGLLGAEVPTP